MVVVAKADITGQRFGSLVAIQFAYSGKNYLSYWIYQCDCGNKHVARANTVKHQTKKGDPELPSCGCVELARKTKHGFRKAEDTHPAYRAYRGMMNRCYNLNSSGYQWYGAVGVTVCDEWKDNPEAFVKWSIENGWSEGLHIDKDIICNAKGISPHIYSPDTCIWTTAKKNVGEATNRKNFGKHPNIKLSQAQVAEILYRYANEDITQMELAQQYDVGRSTIWRLIKLSQESD